MRTSRSLKNRQRTQHCTSLKRELALPSTGSWLPSRLSSTWRWTKRIECIFSNYMEIEVYAKKSGDILSEKRESGMALKSVSLRPKAVLLTPMLYVDVLCVKWRVYHRQSNMMNCYGKRIGLGPKEHWHFQKCGPLLLIPQQLNTKDDYENTSPPIVGPRIGNIYLFIMM